MKTAAILTLGLSLLAVPAAAEEVTEPKTGVAFAGTMDGMALAGVGVRTKAIIKAYAAGLYVDPSGARRSLERFRGRSAEQLGGNDAFFAALTAGPFEKALVMKFTYDVGTERVREAFQEGLATNLADVSGPPQEFLKLFQGDVGRKGDVLLVRATPEGRVSLRCNERDLGAVQDRALAEAVWKIWLGPKPILPKLKSDLIQFFPAILR